MSENIEDLFEKNFSKSMTNEKKYLKNILTKKDYDETVEKEKTGSYEFSQKKQKRILLHSKVTNLQ